MRLTRWNGKKWLLPQGRWRDITERLAAYENTGLEPEQVMALKAGRRDPVQLSDTERSERYDTFTAAVIVHDKAGNVPYVNPTNCNAYLSYAEIKANADNPEAAQEPGANHLVVAVYRDHWHIAQVGGYTPDRGMYTKLF